MLFLMPARCRYCGRPWQPRAGEDADRSYCRACSAARSTEARAYWSATRTTVDLGDYERHFAPLAEPRVWKSNVRNGLHIGITWHTSVYTVLVSTDDGLWEVLISDEHSVRREAAEEVIRLVHTLTTGRRLVITADHGYAASGHFPDTADPAQSSYLKDRFASGRWAKVADLEQPAPGAWVPPLDLPLKTAHADATFALGRRKWKSQGGYPTLTHGGLSLLEVAVPFIELSRTGGA